MDVRFIAIAGIIILAAAYYSGYFNNLGSQPASVVPSTTIDLSKVCNSISSCTSYINANAPSTVVTYVAQNPSKLVCPTDGGCYISEV